ncbi:hypothetical protein ABH931_003851 [Streptacidiphilus sp. MAP12-33]|uniref:DUF4232 domain-containing protein n=1 Tax=Streptacidiphilus sp. MAP12-33 TaxID=3156266 RepID=UPI0035170C31
MTVKSLKSALSSAAVLALGALALTACQPGTNGAAAGTSPSTAASAPASAPASGGSGVTPVSAPSSPSANHGGGGTGGTTGGSGGSGGGDATSDSYAYKHPCSPQQLSIHVTTRAGAPSQRVIAVRNSGARSCGLSYYPLVSLDKSQAPDGATAVKPLVPGGLGGPPAFPVYAGRTAYAVIDLDPSGATSGTVAGINELNVLADGDHMPNADTLNFPLGSGALVLKPKLGLYESSVADAVSSMQSANTQL